jgi:hypothetical protein
MIILYNTYNDSAGRGEITVIIDGLVYASNRSRICRRWRYRQVDCVDRFIRCYLPYRWRIYDPCPWNEDPLGRVTRITNL